ncbi:hypothetical protein [Thermopetrobacter sp. TC1]|uniref:hypothetical protein n=1 Tax=Thermopetrobacter sp. TC1 TaxID=1495045 RepID=UPI000ACC0AFC|nr:hypothetical protein [Thermopetrobacter sp. TC1]
MKHISIGKWRICMPASRIGRIIIGVLLIILGFFGFLPVLGFWMIPLGIAVLSYDIPAVRRLRRRFEVWMFRRLNRCCPRLMAWSGLSRSGAQPARMRRTPPR